MADHPVKEDLTTYAKGDQYHHPDLREAMIQVAQELLESEGPSGWTVRAAARIAGVSSGAPYRHFADKDALLAAVAARGFDELRNEVEQRLAGEGDATTYARFQALGEAYVAFAVARPGRYSIMFGREILNRQMHRALVEAADRTFAALVDEVRRGQESGLLRKDRSADVLAALVWSTIHGLSDLLLSGRLVTVAEGDAMQLMRQVGRTMFEGLLPRD